MGEDVGAGLLAGSNTTSGVPIEHLDYRYVGECKDGKELEKILKVLRSGEEGLYPELIEFTEEKLRKINPKSKSLRKELPINTYRDLTKTEEQEITDDLQEWMATIEQADKSLKTAGVGRELENDNLPPIRTTTASSGESTAKPGPPEEKKKKTVLPRGYQEWDRFDPDKEIESLEKKEEEEKKKKQEKARAMNKNAVPANLDLKDKSETERQVLASREKEKGNESFQTGNYSEALTYYCRSIELNPKTAAVYNNRALVEIRLEKFQEAVNDCNHVLSMEPKNVKAYLRRAIAHQGQGLNQEAKEDLSQVLAIEPNNKRAKELLEEMKKKESTIKDPSNSEMPEDSKNFQNESADIRTSSNTSDSIVTENTPSAKPKGKRLKIVEVDGGKETETSQNLNGTGSVGETSNEPHNKMEQQTETINRTIESDNLQSVETSQVNREPELPALVLKAQKEGLKMFKLGRFAEAAEQFTQAIDILQKDKVVFHRPLCALLCNRGSCLMKIGDCVGCISDCTAALEIIPGAFRPLLKRAEAYEITEKHAKAWQDFQMALKIWPQHLSAIQGTYRVSKSLENLYGPEWKDKVSSPEASSSSTQAAIDNSLTHLTPTQTASEDTNQPHSPQPEISTTKIATESTATHDAIGTTSAAQPSSETINRTIESDNLQSVETSQVNREPELPALVLKAQKEGLKTFKLGRFAEAAEQFTQAIDILQKDKVVFRRPLCALLCNRGSCLMKIGDCAGCISDCTAALEIIPGAFRPLLKRAEAYEITEKHAKAWKDFQMALKIWPQHLSAIQGNYRVSKSLENLYGPEWKDKVSPPEASSSSTQAAVDNSLTHLTPTQTASEDANKPHPPPEISTTKTATESTPAHDAIGTTSAAQPSPPEGATGGTSATSDPSPVTDNSTIESHVDPAVRFSQCKDQGNSFVKQNRYEEAVKCYNECTDIDPENVAVYTNRALCYLRLNQHELAIEDTTEALRLQADNVKALFRRALAKKALCQYDAAARDLFALQKIEPKNAAAKKELEVVLELCRKERRSSQTKEKKPKKKTNDKKVEQQTPLTNHEEKAPKWRRIPIKDVQENDEEDDEHPVSASKQQSSPNKPPGEVPTNSDQKPAAVKPVKLAKNTAYDFFQAWNSVKKNNTKEYADLLRQLETKRLAKVLSNKLDAPMLNGIIAALGQEIVPQGEENLAWDILEQLSHVERFDMVMLFMSSKEKKELQQLFFKLQASFSQQSFVTSEDFERLRNKYRT